MRLLLLAMVAVVFAASAARADGGASDSGADAADAAAASDGADAASSCGAVPAVGCCDGERLLFCENGVLRALSCLARPSCGFVATRGIYDCNTAGSTDPSGATSRSCFFGDAGTPAVDARASADECGDVSEEGCCAGDVLRYCERGVLRQVDCRPNQRCGWRASGLLYDCGTLGGADPSGAFARECSGKPPDLGPLRYDAGASDAAVADAAGDAADAAADAGAPPADQGGCGCRGAPADGRTDPPLWPFVAALVVALARARRRRKSCSL